MNLDGRTFKMKLLFWLVFWCCVEFSLPATAASIEIAGHKAVCTNSTIGINNRLPSEGMNLDGRRILLNLRLMKRWPNPVQLFVFYHECGHSFVGESELEADCWAVRNGIKQEWLKEENLPGICASWEGAPETDTHPSAQRRCRNLYKCFKNATKGIQNAYSSKSTNK